MRSTGLIAVAAALVLAVPAGAHEGEMGLGDALPALPSSSDPAQSGSFGAPFAEPTVGGVATEDRCVVNSDGPGRCKPTAGSVSVLRNGRIVYWNALEGTERIERSLISELRQRRPQRPDAGAEHLRQPVPVERPLARRRRRQPGRERQRSDHPGPATTRRTTTAHSSAPTTPSCPTGACSPWAAPPTTRTRRSATRLRRRGARGPAQLADLQPRYEPLDPDRLDGGRAAGTRAS